MKIANLCGNFLSLILFFMFGIIWMTYTLSGKQWALVQIRAYTGVSIQKVQGKLFDEIIFYNVRYEKFYFSKIVLRWVGDWIELTFPPITIYEYGLQLKNIILRANFIQNGIVRISAELTSGQGVLKVRGDINFFDFDRLQKAEITGKSIQVFNTEEYKVSVSPELKASFDKKSFTLIGTVFIPDAYIKPTNFSGQVVTLSKDVVITQEQSAKKTIINWNLNILVTLGENIAIDVYGLRGKLRGSVKIADHSGGLATGTGIIYVNGYYKEHGQDLSIEQGRIIFSGGDLMNPRLDIQAAKKVNLAQENGMPSQDNTATVGISVTGRFNNKHINLFSKPIHLSQADILSYIILDKPVSDISNADAQLLFKSFSFLGVDSAGGKLNQFKKQLGKLFGLTEIEVGTDKSLNVGKQLSSNLHVSYSLGLFEATQILKLRYLLTKHISLQTETSRKSNAIDVFYTIEKD